MYSQVIDTFTGAISSKVIVRIDDGAFIPADPRNADWQAYQLWLNAGNKPAQPPPAPAPPA